MDKQIEIETESDGEKKGGVKESLRLSHELKRDFLDIFAAAAVAIRLKYLDAIGADISTYH